jgi:hypothetical protein
MNSHKMDRKRLLQIDDVRIVTDKTRITNNKHQVIAEVNRFRISNSRIISQTSPTLKDRVTCLTHALVS